MWSISPAALPKLFLPLTFSHPPPSLSLSSPLQTLTPFPHRTPLSISFSLHHQQPEAKEEEEEEVIIGDCLVFDKDAFDDPSLSLSHHHPHPPSKPKPTAEIEPQDLIPEKWKPVQAAINISKKERRQLARDLEFGRRVEKRLRGLAPIREDVSIEDYVTHRDEKLRQISPVVLERPREGLLSRGVGEERESDEVAMRRSERVAPRNPRMAVYKGGLEDITQFFNSGEYNPTAAKKTEGRRKLFTKEEKIQLSKRIPVLADATCAKWLPLHTLVTSGEFYLMNTLLKHNVDINAKDKDGLTALHRATFSKKQAIFNYLLRESANPFVCDDEGATLMHYAVRGASSQMIKILLLYNVDINVKDNDGWTPLHLAVQTRRTDIVRLLLIKGADTTLKNKDGLTPLDLCLYLGRNTRTYELIKLLKLPPKPRQLV